MKIVKIYGGLGNQMFQYAFGKALEHAGNTVLHDLSWFGEKHRCADRSFELGHFRAGIRRAGFWRRMLCRKVRESRRNVFEPALLTLAGNLFYAGYFQSERYFRHLRAEIAADFSLKAQMSGENKKILERIKSTSSVSLHVRRGDYVRLDETLGADYYRRAIAYIKEHTENPHFYLFSDDVPWVRENIRTDGFPARWLTSTARKWRIATWS